MPPLPRLPVSKPPGFDELLPAETLTREDMAPPPRVSPTGMRDRHYPQQSWDMSRLLAADPPAAHAPLPKPAIVERRATGRHAAKLAPLSPEQSREYVSRASSTR